jgi:hypothetical protein
MAPKTRTDGSGTSKASSTYWITSNWEGSTVTNDELKGLAFFQRRKTTYGVLLVTK